MVRPRQQPLTGRAARRQNEQLLKREQRRAAKRLEQARREGEIVKLDVMQVAVDARGNDFPPEPAEVAKAQIEKREPGKILLRDLIFMSMGDEPSQPGMPGPQAPKEEKAKRWRISVEVYQGPTWEADNDDGRYVQDRAAVMLSTQAFGFLNSAIERAIGEDPPPMPKVEEGTADET